MLAKAAGRLRASRLSAVWVWWCEWAHEVASLRRQQFRCVAWLAQRGLASAWMAWVAWSDESRRQRHCLRKCAVRWRARGLSMAFAQWSALRAQRRRVRAIMQRLLHRELAAALASWVAWVATLQRQRSVLRRCIHRMERNQLVRRHHDPCLLLPSGCLCLPLVHVPRVLMSLCAAGWMTIWLPTTAYVPGALSWGYTSSLTTGSARAWLPSPSASIGGYVHACMRSQTDRYPRRVCSLPLSRRGGMVADGSSCDMGGRAGRSAAAAALHAAAAAQLPRQGGWCHRSERSTPGSCHSLASPNKCALVVYPPGCLAAHHQGWRSWRAAHTQQQRQKAMAAKIVRSMHDSLRSALNSWTHAVQSKRALAARVEHCVRRWQRGVLGERQKAPSQRLRESCDSLAGHICYA